MSLRRTWLLSFAFLCCAFLSGNASLAAQEAMISVANAELKALSSASSETVATLAIGTKLKISDRSKNGFYKAKADSGQMGWIDAKSINIIRKLPKATKSKKEEPLDYIVRAQGGMASFLLTDILAQANVSTLKTGSYFSGEFLFPITPSLHIGLRGDYLYRKTTAKEVTEGDIYTFIITAIPVYLGLTYDFMRTEYIALGGGAYLGAAPQAKISSTGGGSSSELYGMATSAIAKAYMDLTFGFFGLGVEVGYRYLKTGTLTPKNSGSKALFNSASIDLSGLLVGAGLNLRF